GVGVDVVPVSELFAPEGIFDGRVDLLADGFAHQSPSHTTDYRAYGGSHRTSEHAGRGASSGTPHGSSRTRGDRMGTGFAGDNVFVPQFFMSLRPVVQQRFVRTAFVEFVAASIDIVEPISSHRKFLRKIHKVLSGQRS